MEGVIGYTTLFAGNFAPKNWGFCQGQIINIASNTALFSILGTVYGGNGTTTFALPDLRGRAIVGTGTGPGLSTYSLGQNGGSESATISPLQMPAHVHPVSISAHYPSSDNDANLNTPANNVYSRDTNGTSPYTSTQNVSGAPYQATLAMANSGSSVPFPILRPILGLNYIICMYGVYPARN